MRASAAPARGAGAGPGQLPHVQHQGAAVGGHTAALAIHDLAVAQSARLVRRHAGNRHRTCPQRRAGVTCRAFRCRAICSASDRYWLEDIVDPPFPLDPDGFIAVPKVRLGVEVDVDRLEALTVRRQVHGAV